MAYIKLSTLEEVQPKDIIRENLNVNFPNKGWTDEILSPFGYAILKDDGERPKPGPFEKVIKGVPELREQGWYKTFSLEQLTEEEVEEKTNQQKGIISAMKNKLLTDCDWTQLVDVDLVNREEWKSYRQQLREIDQQEGYPFDVTFPAKPEEIWS